MILYLVVLSFSMPPSLSPVSSPFSLFSSLSSLLLLPSFLTGFYIAQPGLEFTVWSRMTLNLILLSTTSWFLWCWRFNPGLCARYAVPPPPEIHPQRLSSLYFYFETGCHWVVQVDLNLWSFYLSLSSSWAHRSVPSSLVDVLHSMSFIITKVELCYILLLLLLLFFLTYWLLWLVLFWQGYLILF